MKDRAIAWKKFSFAFISGFLAVIFFHQVMLFLLNLVSLTTRSAFVMSPTQPFGIPQVLSLAFWGGVWGIILATFFWRSPLSNRYWLIGLLFGAIFPTLVAWFLVFPLKKLPIAAGWKFPEMATSLLVNGAWGMGTVLFLKVFSRSQQP